MQYMTLSIQRLCEITASLRFHFTTVVCPSDMQNNLSKKRLLESMMTIPQPNCNSANLYVRQILTCITYTHFPWTKIHTNTGVVAIFKRPICAAWTKACVCASAVHWCFLLIRTHRHVISVCSVKIIFAPAFLIQHPPFTLKNDCRWIQQNASHDNIKRGTSAKIIITLARKSPCVQIANFSVSVSLKNPQSYSSWYYTLCLFR